METLTPDLCVIGAGAGGLSVAAGAARLGASVVLIEKGAMGGDCLNFGCVPSKALLAAGAAAQAMREAGRFGLRAVEPRADWAQVRAHVKGAIAAIAPMDSQARYEGMGVRVIRAHARFADPRTLEAGGVAVRARRFVIATGSAPATPPIPGLELVRFLTNETVFDLETFPTRLIVLGGGAVGVEMAQAFRRLGSEVVIIEAERALAREDPEMARVALDALRREGVELRENARVTRLEPHGAGLRAILPHAAFEDHIDGSHLLIATGRRPNVDNLGLERAGVRYGPEAIAVGRDMRTSNRRIYAIGDAAGGQATHAASHHATVVLKRALFRLPAKANPAIVPRVVYTEPELASVGLSEAQARAGRRRIRVLRFAVASADRAETEARRSGHIKVVTDAGGEILGCAIAAHGAADLIAPWGLAIGKGLKIDALANLVAPYPTLSEISRRAAIEFYAEKLDGPLARLGLRLARMLG